MLDAVQLDLSLRILGPSHRIGRRLGALALATLLWGATSARATNGPDVAVLPPRIEPVFASVAPGVQDWMRRGLAAAGWSPAERAAVDSAIQAVRASSAPDRALNDTDAVALALTSGAARVLFIELHYREGDAEMRTRLVDGQSGVLLAGSRSRAALSELGTALRAGLDALLGSAGSPLPRARLPAAPSLEALGAYGRADLARQRGEWVAAWRELEVARGTFGDALRRELLASSQHRDVPFTERSRLASLRGKNDEHWLAVRRELKNGGGSQALLAGGDAARARGDLEGALRFYEKAAAGAPTEPVAVLERARTLGELGLPEEARGAYEIAVALAPDAPEPLEGLAATDGLDTDLRARSWMQAGVLRANRLEPAAAERAFRAASSLDPQLEGSAQRSLAGLNERLGLHGEALLAYEKAAELTPEDADLLAGIGRARSRTGDIPGAEDAFHRALTVERGHRESLRGIGAMLTLAGHPEHAIPYLDELVQAAPSDALARSTLARAQHAAGDPAAALETLKAVQLAPQLASTQQSDLLALTAEIQLGAGRLDEAERTLDQAIALEPNDPKLLDLRAEAYIQRGDLTQGELLRSKLALLEGEAPEGAEASLGEEAPSAAAADLAALIESFPHRLDKARPLGPVMLLGLAHQSGWAETLRRWLLPRRPDTEALEQGLVDALLPRFALAVPEEIPVSTHEPIARLLAFEKSADDVLRVTADLGVGAVFVAQLGSEAETVWQRALGMSPTLELRLLSGTRIDDVIILSNRLALAGSDLVVWNPRALLPWGVLTLLAGLWMRRGWGSVIVALDYETERGAKGFFSIELSRNPGRAKQDRSRRPTLKESQYRRRTRAWSRTSRSMVGRVTRFRMLPARTWYVVVHGLLQDATTKEVIGNYLAEQKVCLARGQTAQVSIDLRPKEAPLDIAVARPEGDDTPVLVTLRGRPDALRYIKGDSTVLYVGNGEHVVQVGMGDRVLEQTIHISDYERAQLGFHPEREIDAVFTGCPEAVEPFMQGDLPAAWAALERAGQTDTAGLLRARFHQERGDGEEAARLYEAAGKLESAAELHDSDEAAGHSATLFEQAGDFGKAAARYLQAGDTLRAAAAYEAAFDYENAIDAYQSAGQPTKAMELLEKTGRYYEAAVVALAEEDSERAIRDLQQVDLRDPNWTETCRLLGRLFAEREAWEPAVEKGREAVASAGGDAAPLDIQFDLACSLEGAGHVEEALACYEGIRTRDFEYPEVGQRIAALRERLAAAREETAIRSAGQDEKTSAPPVESRYELLAEAGRGGMGVVHKARDRRLGRVVALKRLPDNLKDHPTAVSLFLREARAAAALNHPNIVTLYDADQEDGQYYLTMEFLEGHPFNQILKERGRLKVRDTLALAVQVATGLQYAHEQRIVHRDIKTSNLFLTRERVVKIMDFGLAKMLEEVRRANTVIAGTPYYMAPEQAAGETVDHRADLYAFGVTLFELLTGSVPFSKGDVTYHHRHTPAPDPRERVQDIPEVVAKLILRLMAKQPEARFATTAEVSGILRKLARAARRPRS